VVVDDPHPEAEDDDEHGLVRLSCHPHQLLDVVAIYLDVGASELVKLLRNGDVELLGVVDLATEVGLIESDDDDAAQAVPHACQDRHLVQSVQPRSEVRFILHLHHQEYAQNYQRSDELHIHDFIAESGGQDQENNLLEERHEFPVEVALADLFRTDSNQNSIVRDGVVQESQDWLAELLATNLELWPSVLGRESAVVFNWELFVGDFSIN